MKLFMYILNFLLFVSCINRDTIIDKNQLNGNDYRLFQGTEVWDLAKAVQDENIEKIKRIIKKNSVNINFQESEFGQTLLMLSVKNHHINSAKALLELGADLHIHNTFDGSTAIIEAASINSIYKIDIDLIKLLLEFGADPNDIELGERPKGNTTRMTPLLEAARSLNKGVSPIGKVKLLVESGADINFINEFNQFALKEAIIQDNYDVAFYLLQCGADFRQVFFDRSKFTNNGKKLYLADVLREDLLPLDSEKYQDKMKIIIFLNTKGVEYRNIPIPDFVVKEAKEMYPDNWKEYLEKY